VAEKLATGRAPVPERLTAWVDELALSVMVSVPLRVPVVVGAKVTLTEHEEEGARLEPQVLVSEKSPLVVMLLTLSVALPVFSRVTFCALLFDPTSCAANVKEVEERLATAAVPVPLRLTV